MEMKGMMALPHSPEPQLTRAAPRLGAEPPERIQSCLPSKNHAKRAKQSKREKKQRIPRERKKKRKEEPILERERVKAVAL
ncbi:hypothetical protein VNO77_43028 [Canavalia gladiata]|uniref:Uncharacterized protein n=1 Tax=Canavalia gladiata TaxID=3824 RepID=A0AAN9JVR9_CANGL